LGNGNWHFGSNNSTIGNGNWDFGSNNTVIGNGNWLFTSNNTVVGNGNWLVDGDNITSPETLLPEIKTTVDDLINSLMGRIGEDFIGLTGNLGESESQTFNRLILAKDTGTNDGNVQSVPEPGFSTPMVVLGVSFLLYSRLKKRSRQKLSV
jgi:hypothetical protein